MNSFFSRLIKLTAVLVIVASVFGPGTPLPVFIAHADVPRYNDLTDSRNALAPGQTVPSANLSKYATGNTDGSSGTDLECTVSSGKGLAVCVSSLVYWITVGIGSWVANITAYVFDYAVQLSLTGSAYALDFIAIGWGIVRDVANMSFLFILVYISFKIMFQAETSGTIRMLVWVVVIALLVNFSFTMTRLVIDAGNIVALQFYNAIAPPNDANTPTISNPGSGSVGATKTADITAPIMNALNPQNILGTSFQNFVSDKNNNSAMYYLIVSSVVYIMVGATLFMTAAVFIFAAIKFIMRVAGLWLVIVAAPAAFVAAIFRGKEGGSRWFNTWLGYLLEFSFYPAVFLFMYYIEMRFMNEMASTSLFNNAFNATASAADWRTIVQAAANVGVRLGFILTTMYLILRASTWMGEAFNKVGTSWVQGKVFGLGRSTLKYGGQGIFGGLRFATQPIRAGIQSQANAATRAGVNSTLWRSINRAVGGTNTARPSGLTLSGALTRSGQQVTQQGNRQTQQGQQAAGGERVEPKVPDYTGAAPEVRVSLPGSRNAENLPGGPRRIEPVIPMGRAPEVRVGARNTQGVINEVAASSAARNAVPTVMNTAAQRAIEGLQEAGRKAQETARAGAVAVNLVTPTPDMSRSPITQRQVAEPAAVMADASGIKEEIRGLNQSVREAVAAAKNGGSMPQKIVVSVPEHAGPLVKPHTDIDYDKMKEAMKQVVRKEVGKLHTGPTDDHTPPPAAPAAAKPAPQTHEAHNDDYPYSQAAE